MNGIGSSPGSQALNPSRLAPHVAQPQQRGVVPTRRGPLVLPPLNRPHRDAQERRDVAGIRKAQEVPESQPRRRPVARLACTVVRVPRPVRSARPLRVKARLMRNHRGRLRWTSATLCRFGSHRYLEVCATWCRSPRIRRERRGVVQTSPRRNVAPLEQGDKVSLYDRGATAGRCPGGRR